jgi:hypothetical protein
MKRQSAHLFVAVILALLGPLAQNGRGNFILWNDEQFTVNSYHNQGTLYDISRAFIVPGGSVDYLYVYDSGAVGVSGGFVNSDLNAYDFSAVDISGGSIGSLNARNSTDVNISGGSIGKLYAYDYSVVDISGGDIGRTYGGDKLNAYDFSSVNISGGSVNILITYNSSTVNISSGSLNGLGAYNSSAVNISGGSFNYLGAVDSTDVNISGGSTGSLNAWGVCAVSISGGSLNYLDARNSSVVTFYGQNFRVGGGLAFDGERVLGTGILSGEWMDGTRWATNITYNETTATILAIPESAHKPFCAKYPRMDFNGDCKVDFADFAIMASSWLECNLVPQSACWE